MDSNTNFKNLEKKYNILMNKYLEKKKNYINFINKYKNQLKQPDYNILGWKDYPRVDFGKDLIDLKGSNKNWEYLGQANSLNMCKDLSQYSENNPEPIIINVGSSNTNTKVVTLPCYQGDCPNYYGCSSKGRCGCLDYCGYDKRCCKGDGLYCWSYTTK